MGIQSNNTWSNNNNIYNPYYSHFRTSAVPADVNVQISCDFTLRDKFSRANPQLKIASCRYKQFHKHSKCPSQSVQILRLRLGSAGAARWLSPLTEEEVLLTGHPLLCEGGGQGNPHSESKWLFRFIMALPSENRGTQSPTV